MELYWLPLLKHLKAYMCTAKDPENPDQLLFDGVDVNIGMGGGATFPYIDLIWAGESNLPRTSQGRRTVELWIDCWSKYVKSDTEAFCDELYELQKAVALVLETWPRHLEAHTFEGGRRYGVLLEVKKLCSDGEVRPPTTASRFIVELSVKEGLRERSPLLRTRTI